MTRGRKWFLFVKDFIQGLGIYHSSKYVCALLAESRALSFKNACCATNSTFQDIRVC